LNSFDCDWENQTVGLKLTRIVTKINPNTITSSGHHVSNHTSDFGSLEELIATRLPDASHES